MDNESREIKFSLSGRIFNSIFSIAALIVLAITHVIINFGGGTPVLVGIMSIIVLALAVFGVIWQLIKQPSLSVDFVFAAGVAMVSILTL